MEINENTGLCVNCPLPEFRGRAETTLEFIKTEVMALRVEVNEIREDVISIKLARAESRGRARGKQVAYASVGGAIALILNWVKDLVFMKG